MELASVAAAVSIPAGGFAVLAALRKVFRTLDRLEQAVQVDNQGRTMSEQVAAINRELHPNGGGSLRDAVDRATVHIEVVRDIAVEARESAKDAAEKAMRAELSGNFDRADIRRKLDAIDKTTRSTRDSLDKHLNDPEAHPRSA